MTARAVLTPGQAQTVERAAALHDALAAGRPALELHTGRTGAEAVPYALGCAQVTIGLLLDVIAALTGTAR